MGCNLFAALKQNSAEMNRKKKEKKRKRINEILYNSASLVFILEKKKHARSSTLLTCKENFNIHSDIH